MSELHHLVSSQQENDQWLPLMSFSFQTRFKHVFFLPAVHLTGRIYFSFIWSFKNKVLETKLKYALHDF